MADFEKLGVFYLGKKYDIAGHRRLDDLVLYDSSDLTTHAVCIGMTGSGKTGLCLGLLEEAAIDGIPVIAIDPKGDLGNLLLSFPNLAAADFEPWVDAGEARRQGITADQLASQEAAKWTAGLKEWGQDGARIKRLRESAEMTIYTPGSSAGVPVSILHSLGLPDRAILDDEDLLREKVASAAACILALLGIDFDPLKSREFILVAAIIADLWSRGKDVVLTDLIGLIQKPPMTRVGALDLETFYPAKERNELSLLVNNLLASPGFAAWLTGEALDIDKFLYCPEGKPRLSIFSISHLSDSERMFFVTFLLNQIISWMRSQSGTPSLRAIIYMDEIFGFFPPVANPPAKQPLLTLLKQARAFGLGIMLASQNPVDIDYKGLSNAGTWFIGRLQTDRDKQRVLDGLESARAESGSVAGGGRSDFDRQAMSEVLSSLGQRVFLMNNVHEEGPVVFETRFTMSYLRGPLARQEIKRLMEPARNKAVNSAAPPLAEQGVKLSAPTAVPQTDSVPKSEPKSQPNSQPKPVSGGPLIDPAINQLYVPVAVAAFSGSATNKFEATLLASAVVRFSDSKAGVEITQERNYLVPVSTKGALAIDFQNAKAIKTNLADLPTVPPGLADMVYLEPHADLLKAANYKNYNRDFVAFLAASCKLKLFRSPSTGLTSLAGESERDFRIRLAQAGGEKRDQAVSALREKYRARIATLEEKVRQADYKIDQEAAQAKQAEVDSAIAIGATVLGAFMGRKPLGSTSVGRATTAARGVNRAAKQRQDVEQARSNRDELAQKLHDLNNQFAAEAASIGSRFDSQTEVLQETIILPKKTAIKVNLVGLAWVKG